MYLMPQFDIHENLCVDLLMRIFFIILTVYLVIFSSSVNALAFRMSPMKLHKNVDNHELVILDARNVDEYDVLHIKNAINFPVKLTYKNKNVNGQLQTPVKMQAYLRARGISINSNVIIYDDGQLVDAARVFWALEAYGLTSVKILDHGFNYWLSKELATTQDIPVVKPSQYVATINHQRLSSKFTTQLAIYNKNKILIDARSNVAYKGEISSAKRFGHIPSAINLPFNQNIMQDAEFFALKPKSELEKIYAAIPRDKKIIIYCKIGRVSSTNYFALRELGHDVSNYDASWREWGNDETLPIEK